MSKLVSRMAALEDVQKAQGGPDVIVLVSRDVELTPELEAQADDAREPGRVVVIGGCDES